MKKKGFTLIELLAVIVILAIIALIATPLVIKYIEKSRKESKVDSAYSFVRNLETEITNCAIKNNGKKYTTDKENIKELGLDITVKGENPTDGKVCISSVGQIEKGVFQYGKYYVSYDGKKGSIIDKDTYDNFSCSGNIGVINDMLMKFQYDSANEIYIADLKTGGATIMSKINTPAEYKLIIKNKDTKEVLVSDYLLAFLDGPDLVLYGEEIGDASNMAKYDIMFIEDEMNITIEANYSPKLTEGEHMVSLIPTDREFIPASFKIDASGVSWLMGFDIVPGISANVSITNEEGNVYCNKDVVFSEFDYANLESSGTGNDCGKLPEVYNDIANGKIITVKITQNIDGVDVVTTIVGNNPILQKGVSVNGDVYSIGNNLFVII